MTPQQLRELEGKYDASRTWFGWSDWDTFSNSVRGALMSEAVWQNAEISGGILSPSRESRMTHIYIDSEGSLPNDLLETIAVPSNAANGDMLIIRQLNGGRVIEVGHLLGNINTLGGANYSLDKTALSYDLTIMMLIDLVWFEIIRHPSPSVTDRLTSTLAFEPVNSEVSGGSLNVESALVHVTGPVTGATAATGTIDVTLAGGDAGVIDVWVQLPSGAGEYKIGSYTQDPADTEAGIEIGIAAGINALTADTGWTAAYNGGTFLTDVTAPIAVAAAANFYSLAIANGTATAITVSLMAGGVDGVAGPADIDTIVGLPTHGVATLVNRNVTGNMSFVGGGNLVMQGGSILQPGAMAQVIGQDTSVIVQILEPMASVTSIASADILQIGTTPFEIIANAAAGYAWEFELFIKSKFVTTAYTLATASYLYLVDQSANILLQMPTDLLTVGASQIYRVQLYSPMLAGKGVYLTTDDASNPTLGDGTWEVLVKKVGHKF